MTNKITFILLFCCLRSLTWANDVLQLPQDLSHLKLDPFLEILEAPGEDQTNLSLEELRRGTYHPLQGEAIFTPYFGSDIWARTRFQTTTTMAPILLVSRAFHIKLECFLLKTSSGNWKALNPGPRKSGNSLPYFPLQLEANQIYELYVHINNAGSVGLHPLSLHSQASLLHKFQNRHLINGVFFGAMSLILIVSIYLYLVTRRREMLFYAFYLFFTSIFLFINDGFAYALIFPDAPSLNPVLLSVVLALGIICEVMVFTLAFRKEIGKGMERTGRTFILLSLLFIPLAFIPEINRIIIFLNNFTVLGSIFYLGISAFILARRKVPFAMTFFVAYFFLTTGILSHIFLAVAWLSPTVLPVNPLKVCIFLEFILLASGLINMVLAQVRQSQSRSMSALKKLHRTQLKLLASRMNPHFIHNSLASIQNLILTQDKFAASEHLSQLGKLLRKTFDHSSQSLVTLADDLEHLELYVSLEELRTRADFQFAVSLGEKVNPEQVEIPNMIFQPFVENAIWHGIRYLDHPGNIQVKIEQAGDVLEVEIEDNGIGREAAKAHRGKRKKDRPSGLGITEQRIRMHNDWPDTEAAFTFEDLVDPRGKGIGTRVRFRLRLFLKSRTEE